MSELGTYPASVNFVVFPATVPPPHFPLPSLRWHLLF